MKQNLMFFLFSIGFLSGFITDVVSIMDDHDGFDNNHGFSNEWIIGLTSEKEFDDPTSLARTLGYENMGAINGFPSYYLWKKTNHLDRDLIDARVHTRDLQEHDRITFAQQLFHKKRDKRGYLEDKIVKNIRGISPKLLHLWDLERQKYQTHDSFKSELESKKSEKFNDFFWSHQWYMNQKSQSSLNVLPVYELGFSGKGISISVLDDGLEHTHEDLKNNYDPNLSYDFNNGTTGDPDPSPSLTPNSLKSLNYHGTRCAGEISMTANNGLCGVGMAFGSKIGGIKILDGEINDRIEGLALQFNLETIDIYTASWGPTDDGKTVESPGHLAKKALEKGISEGRQGKGAIYVWASGNGGKHKDNCNCDGYTSSIYTISISSATEHGNFPWYGEQCSSTLGATYSSGTDSDHKITTTDTNNTCTISHTGTSAAAPLAAGIIALVLEANSSLNWRDVQYLIVYSSSKEALKNNEGWFTNGKGLAFNSRFGFGLLNAGKMVSYALNWISVPAKSTESYTSEIKTDDHESVLRSRVLKSIFFNVSNSKIRSLEHVQVQVTIVYPLRGSLEISLTSPSGTVSKLLTRRPRDKSSNGFMNWYFMSVHFWGENPKGVWKVDILDGVKEDLIGRVKELNLIVHGIFQNWKSPIDS